MLVPALIIVIVILVIAYFYLRYYYESAGYTVEEYFKIDKRLPRSVSRSLESVDGTRTIKIFDIDERDKAQMDRVENAEHPRSSGGKSDFYDAVSATFKASTMLSDEEPAVIGGFDKKRTGTMKGGSIESRDRRLQVKKANMPSRASDRDGYRDM